MKLVGKLGSPEKKNTFNVKVISILSSEMLDSSKGRSSVQPMKPLNIDQWRSEKKIKSRNAGMRGDE